MADENKQQGQDGNPQPESLTMSKADFEAKLNGKFGEGAKKEAKRILEELGVANFDEAKAAIKSNKESSEKASKAEAELTVLKAERMAMKFGASADDAEDAIALLKGKGQELTEENIKAVVEKRFKAAPNGTPGGTLPGGTKTTEPPKAKRVI